MLLEILNYKAFFIVQCLCWNQTINTQTIGLIDFKFSTFIDSEFHM